MSKPNEYVIIIEKANGNESVGTMWQETKIFNGYRTLDEVMRWASNSYGAHSTECIKITKPHERDKEEK